MATGDIRLLTEAATSMGTTELNSLSNNAAVLTAAYDNGAAGALYEFAHFELAVTWGTGPTANATVELYLVQATDGTNYEDGSNTPVATLNSFIGSIFVRNTTSRQIVVLKRADGGGIRIPPCPFKVLVYNKSGQAFPASGSTLKILPWAHKVA